MSTPTIIVKDGNGNEQTLFSVSENGPALAASSRSTIPATDLANIEPAGVPVTGSSMPAGGVGITGWLSAIWATLGGTLKISATALPLPAGAATDDNLTAIATAIEALEASTLASIGSPNDPVATNATGSWSLISLTKGLLAAALAAGPINALTYNDSTLTYGGATLTYGAAS